MRTLLTGGVKSGKSSRALVIARAFPEPRYFLATAEPFDGEMSARIARHKADRADAFITIEEPLDVQDELRENMVLDCVTLWLNNLFHYGRGDRIEEEVERLIARLPRNIVLVTNEVGLGIVPADPLSRLYSEALGRTNARLASACDEVVLMVAGLPLAVKSPK
jgi:adenosylcobinamide kinase / adenosylcobinamide-phosphate guanylyltransferase